MTNKSAQEILDRILADLQSDDTKLIIAAIADLETLAYNSHAIRSQLEHLATGENYEVRSVALRALSLKTSQHVAGKSSKVARSERELILSEIQHWLKDGLLDLQYAETIRRRYDFDIREGIPTRLAKAESKTELQSQVPVKEEAVADVVVVKETSEPVQAPHRPSEPRPSLTQVLLSETSTRIYLYLGAFFVIAAAAILAALVEAARLPILLIATLLFGGAAVGFKKRLPQPSFAFAIVFSFLLPIDAGVLADNIPLASTEAYWGIVFLFMALIWGFGTWFYTSRIFSLAAYYALLLGIANLSDFLDASTQWTIVIVTFVNVATLLGVNSLKNWKDAKFAAPIYITAQVVQLIAMFISLIALLADFFGGAPARADWIAITLTWISAAAFFAASHYIIPFPLLPWTAVASLIVFPWFFLAIFQPDNPAYLAGYGLLGIILALTSKFLARAKSNSVRDYHYPALALSLPVFLVSIALGLAEGPQYTFATFLVTGVTYTIIHAMQPRWYVWLAALLAGLGAYFSFFNLPALASIRLDISYQILIASLLLLIAELTFKEPLTFARSWNWVPVMLGSILVTVNILIVHATLSVQDGYFDNAAIIMGVYAILFAAFALRFKQTVLGYFATTSTTLTVLYALIHYERDLWLPSLTALTVAYYVAGFWFARREQQSWSVMLINSSLTLGVILSGVSFFALKPGGGWYVLLIAAVFLVELLTRHVGLLELLFNSLLSAALVLILNDAKVDEIAYSVFGVSLIWLASDTSLHLILNEKRQKPIEQVVHAISGLFTLGAVFSIVGTLASAPTAICFGVYTVCFAALARIYKKSRLGYFSTASAATTLFFTLDHFHVSSWLYILTGLSVVYYAASHFIRAEAGWAEMARNSGFGLGIILSFIAPSQTGGIEKAIPIAIVATLFAVEAYTRRNVWLAFPANALYLFSYFTLLDELKVEQTQYYSIGAALLGMVMHYLLMRAGSKAGAFIMGLLSQLVLLGTTYIQMISDRNLGFFFMLFGQSLLVLVYGILMRSRSLVIAPIGFAVLGVVTVLYDALRDLSLVVIIGATGLVLLTLGVLAVLMRERIATFAERFSDWNA